MRFKNASSKHVVRERFEPGYEIECQVGSGSEKKVSDPQTWLLIYKVGNVTVRISGAYPIISIVSILSQKQYNGFFLPLADALKGTVAILHTGTPSNNIIYKFLWQNLTLEVMN